MAHRAWKTGPYPGAVCGALLGSLTPSRQSARHLDEPPGKAGTAKEASNALVGLLDAIERGCPCSP